MQVSATDIFRVGSATGTVARRSSSLTDVAAGSATRAEQDIISISEIAKQMQARAAQTGDGGFVAKGSAAAQSRQASGLAGALTGEVAKIFGHLSDEAKGQLERGVAGGKVSLKEIEEGLKYLANQEIAVGVQRARVRGPEEIAAINERKQLRDLQQKHGEETGVIFNQMDELNRKRQLGELSDEDFEKQMKPLYAAVDQLDNSAEYKDLSDRYNAAQDKAVKMSFDGWQTALGGPPNEAKWQASMEKLDSIGFDVQRNRQSFKNYAESQETPTMFRADAA